MTNKTDLERCGAPFFAPFEEIDDKLYRPVFFGITTPA